MLKSDTQKERSSKEEAEDQENEHPTADGHGPGRKIHKLLCHRQSMLVSILVSYFITYLPASSSRVCNCCPRLALLLAPLTTS